MKETHYSSQQQSSPPQTDLSKRKWIGGAAALVALSPGLRLVELAAAKPNDQPASSAVRWGMLVDTERCTDSCTACVDACQLENGWGKGSTDESRSRATQKAHWIRKVKLRDRETEKTHILPLFCQHCENPPCVDVCPTGASFKRADGIVLVDKHICIGCRYCMMACPYKARSFIHEALHDQRVLVPRGKGTVESCTFCVQRVDRGEQPACVEACAKLGNKALTFGDLSDPESAIAKQRTEVTSRAIRADLALNPRVRYQGI